MTGQLLPSDGPKTTAAVTDWERTEDYEQREREIYARADLLAAISEEDRRGMRELVPGLPVELLPMIAEAAPAGPNFSAREGFCFLGNFDNLANQDALSWLLEEIWPGVRERLPEARLFLAGNNLPAERIAQRSGIVCLGHVPELESLWERHRVFLSPIRFGTGIKTKNLAALAHGMPLVTTTIGSEAMSLSAETPALIADTTPEFVAATVRTYRDESLREVLACNGRTHILREWQQAEQILTAGLTDFPPARNLPEALAEVRRVQAGQPRFWPDTAASPIPPTGPD